jgi:hypothetical protein
MTGLESNGVQVTETDDCLRISWESRDVPKDNCLFGWLVLFGQAEWAVRFQSL